jgi:hypothetical protein
MANEFPPRALDPVTRPEIVAVGVKELAARVRRRSAPLSAVELLTWLIAEDLAVEHEGLLEPTVRCLELGGGLDAS